MVRIGGLLISHNFLTFKIRKNRKRRLNPNFDVQEARKIVFTHFLRKAYKDKFNDIPGQMVSS